MKRISVLMFITLSVAVVLYYSLLLNADVKWQLATPASQGMDREKLDLMCATLATKGTKAFLVVRHNRIVYEWYASGYGPRRRHFTAGLAGSLVGSFSLMLALTDGRVKLNDSAWEYVPSWKNDPIRSQITLHHLATHSSGLAHAHGSVGGWEKAFKERIPDPFSVAINKAPILFPPGSQSAYSGPGYAVLAYALTASLKGAPQSDIYNMLKERIMDPIGVPDDHWTISYGNTDYRVDGLRLYAMWGGGSYTPRAVARMGQLLLFKGSWEGQQLLDPTIVEKATSYAGFPRQNSALNSPRPGRGLGWTTNSDGIWPRLPQDAFAGVGAEQQLLVVIPSLNLVSVRMGNQLFVRTNDQDAWHAIEDLVFNPLMDAVTDNPGA